MIIINTVKKRFFSVFAGMFCIFFAVYLFYDAQRATSVFQNSLAVCTKVLFPPLFLFSVTVGMASLCQIDTAIGKIIGKPFSKITGLPENTAYAFIAGALGGFPLGAVAAGELWENGEISSDELFRLTLISNNASPAFCISVIGLGLYNDLTFGIYLYISQLLSSLTVGFLMRKKTPYSVREFHPASKKTIPQIIVNSGMNILKVCFFYLFFASVGDAIVRCFPENSVISSVLLCFTELTTAVKNASGTGVYGILLTAFATGFSGMSVIMQIFSVLEKTSLPRMKLIRGKLLCGIINILFCVPYIILGSSSGKL